MRLRAGLTGGIGSGKSAVADIFAELGALVVDADELARLAVAPGSEGLARIAPRWPQALHPDGSLDRAALSAIVFADLRQLDELNAIVHPLVRRLGDELEASAAPDQIVVHEVPLLFETELYRRCQVNVLVVAPPQTRIARVVARSGLDRAEVERRMRAQIDPARARELADYVIDNDGTPAELRERATLVYRALETRGAKAR
ncbi:MAG: dephospho-CoA kinase [Vulcanimicrobiaceae bacterium]